MARTSPRRVTRADREAARDAAARTDIGPFVRGFVIVVAIGILAYGAILLAPSEVGLGGPLQGGVVSGASLTTIRKTGGEPVSLVVPVPWNAGAGNAIVDRVVPIEADGLDVKRVGVLPPGGPSLVSQRGFPPSGVSLVPLEGYTVSPGASELDGFRVVIGLSGEGTVAGFALHYRVGGVGYVAILPDGAMLCADACEGREDAEEAQRADVARFADFVELPER